MQLHVQPSLPAVLDITIDITVKIMTITALYLGGKHLLLFSLCVTAHAATQQREKRQM